jgi:hypothetical protein
MEKTRSKSASVTSSICFPITSTPAFATLANGGKRDEAPVTNASDTYRKPTFGSALLLPLPLQAPDGVLCPFSDVQLAVGEGHLEKADAPGVAQGLVDAGNDRHGPESR